MPNEEPTRALVQMSSLTLVPIVKSEEPGEGRIVLRVFQNFLPEAIQWQWTSEKQKQRAIDWEKGLVNTIELGLDEQLPHLLDEVRQLLLEEFLKKNGIEFGRMEQLREGVKEIKGSFDSASDWEKWYTRFDIRDGAIRLPLQVIETIKLLSNLPIERVAIFTPKKYHPGWAALGVRVGKRWYRIGRKWQSEDISSRF